jgi:hypothetical protein
MSMVLSDEGFLINRNIIANTQVFVVDLLSTFNRGMIFMFCWERISTVVELFQFYRNRNGQSRVGVCTCTVIRSACHWVYFTQCIQGPVHHYSLELNRVKHFTTLTVTLKQQPRFPVSIPTHSQLAHAHAHIRTHNTHTHTHTHTHTYTHTVLQRWIHAWWHTYTHL